MKLLEIKNNLVKIAYNSDEPLALAKFIALVDKNRSYVGQIVNLKADIKSNYAVAKLIFTFNDEGIVDNYDGTIPSLQAELSYLNSKDILELLPIETPIAFGDLAQQEEMLKLDQTIFEKNLVICAEKFDNINTIVKNSVYQLNEYNEKAVVIDTDYTFGEFEPIRFKRDFKLPLNARMINYIYENDLEEVDAASKAVIQDIFYEVQEYTKTVEGNFIPFDTFLKVVSQQYTATNIPELALLKNKLLKYQEANVFAQTAEDLEGLKNAFDSHILTFVDIADVQESLQKELIAYIHSVLNKTNEYLYMFVKLNNKNADKKLLKQLIDNEHIFSTVICSHNYKYLAELKQRAENVILFAPQTTQHDFASYNTFLSKLNANEFIVYGALTQHIPFIVELAEITKDSLESNDTVEENIPVTVTETEEQLQSEEVSESAEEDAPAVYDFSALNELKETDEETIVYPENEEVFEEFEQPEEYEIVSEEVTQTEEFDHDELVEQVAKDVDEVFYGNKAEEIPSIEDITEPDEEILTEDDLDFIDELPQQEENFNEIEFVEQEIEDTEEDENFAVEAEEPVEIIMDEPVLEDIPTDFEELSTVEEAEQEPEIPIYPAEEPVTDTIAFEQGDTVSHPKYGKGVIEKLIKYGNKTLCSISFENVGRRLLDPAISELEKL